MDHRLNCLCIVIIIITILICVYHHHDPNLVKKASPRCFPSGKNPYRILETATILRKFHECTLFLGLEA
ncbi:hypothetical protein EUGRSUZ_F00724 [Eucalyptus grandis]|uniref:Uncharacterized protein n=2 Tax=Eucalyptus grandis TaxID=71139 RepID=A0ACC3KCI0_EUCGR|nr:hypothetical protein EUGRSUZ_F00724 [Eucalyptus grandis]